MQSPETKIILASKSSRRRYLLDQAGVKFDVVPSTIDETFHTADTSKSHARSLAEKKADVVARQFPEAYIIGADTIVVVNETILGKPNSAHEARWMLQKLSERTHVVMTGWAICCRSHRYRFSQTVRTTVQFKSLTDAEIQWYLDTGEPFDKAGAYAIQGQGAFMVKWINGSYSNVVGLPLSEVIDHLNELNLIPHFNATK